MSYERNIKWLNDRRILYRKDPDTDIPTIETEKYKFYEDGTYQCYHLFNSRAKITTYKSLKWHMLVLYYLNTDNIINSDFVTLARFIADKENGFVTFFIKNKLLEGMIGDVLQQGGDAPKNRKRKIIFKDFSGLILNEKLSIVGKLIGRKSRVWPEDIYQCMLDMNEFGKKITWGRIAGLLDCSERTIHRNLDDQLKQIKKELNEEL
jgi:hypothetical protein